MCNHFTRAPTIAFSYATTDGQRFLVNSMPEGATPKISVISNWTTTLKD